MTFNVQINQRRIFGTDANLADDTNIPDGVTLAFSVDEDFGDAPASYDATAAASHVVGDLKLGSTIDADNTGTLNGGTAVTPSPNAVAAGADNTGTNGDGADEDAITSFPALSTANTSYSLTVPISGASQAGQVCGWIDFDRGGTFGNVATERACAAFAAGASSVTLTWSGLSGLTVGQNYVRLRASYDTAGVQNPTGRLDSGEVEDYRLNIILPADLSITKTDGVTTVAVSGATTYTVRVTNNGPGSVTGAVLNDPAASGLSKGAVSCSSAAGNTCVTAPTATQLESAGGVVLPTLASGAFYEIVVPAAVTATSGTVVNTATVTSPSSNVDPSPGNNSATDSDTVAVIADLAVSKTAPTSVAQGGTLTYTVRVWNNGPSPVTGAGITDAVPGNLTGVTWTCSATGSASCSAPSGTGSTVSLTANLSADTGSAATADTNYVTLLISGTATDAGTITNTASVAAPTGATDGTASNNSSAASTFIAPQVTCSALYGTVGGDFSGATGNNGTEIRAISDTTNVQGALIASIPATSTGQTGYTATLAMTPDRSKFFVVRDIDNRLLIFDVATGIWTDGPQLPSTLSRYVRMAITSNNIGYVMDGDGKFYSFTTTSPYSVSAAQTLTKLPASAPALGLSGDFFADNRGNLFLLSSTNADGFLDFWEVEPSTLNLVFLGRINDPDIIGAYGGFGATPNGLFGRGSNGRMISVDLRAFSAAQIGSVTVGSTDLASCTFPSLTRAVTATKTAVRVGGGTTVSQGDTLEYTITVRNTGSVAAGNTQFQDLIPAGTTYVAGTTTLNGAAVTDATGSVMPYTQAGQLINSPGQPAGTLLVDQTPGDATDREAVIRFRVTVNANPPAQVSNQGTVLYRDNASVVTVLTDDPQTAPVNDATVTTVTPLADLAIDKSGPAAVGSGGSVSYTVRVWNNGPNVVSGATVTDTLPAGFTGVTVTCAATGTATCGSTATAGGTLTLTTGTLTLDSNVANATPDGNFLTYTITGTAPTSGQLSNSASVSVPAGALETTAANNTSATVVTRIVDAVTDPAVTLTFGAGGTVSVLGNDTVGIVVATNTTAVVTLQNAGGITGLSVNGSGQLVVPAGTPSGTYTVTYKLCDATVTTACDTATVAVTVGPASTDVSVTKTGPAFAKPDQQITYTLLVKNESANPAAAVTATDDLPTSVTYVSSTPAATVSGQTLTWALGTLAGGASQTLTVVVKVPSEATLGSTAAARTLTNTASVSTTTSDTVPGNNTSSAVTQMIGAKLVKSVRNVTAGTVAGTSGGGRPAEVLEYCIAFENIGGAALPNFVVTDQVPGNTTAQLTGFDAEEPSAATGFGVKLTRGVATPATSYLTSAADTTDAGSLSDTAGTYGRGTLSVNLGSLGVGEKGSVCFRAAIR
ncbi:hypothetical protein GCM10008956_26130 [Deinococcus arenae]|uniref:DUF11 domain-containing protein n=1 Tax=Deinococcus arenae TaxID=1452751 RepID=A0A8H9GQP3_9DEIO|nr:hypothetical protein GCM10008956_26130 [Deinococcus arenae]